MQYGPGSTSTILNSTTRIAPRTLNYICDYLCVNDVVPEHIAFFNRTVCFEEIRFQVNIEEIASDSLDSVIDGQYVDSLSVLYISARMYCYDF
jgi:hypothetical protein